MPAPYGVVPSGFSVPTLEEIKASIEDDQHSLIHPSLNVNSNTPVGQLNGIYASKLRELWEAVQVAAGLMDPDNVSDAQLDALAKITGTVRAASTKSTVSDVTINLDTGAYPARSLVASVVGSPDSRFVNRDEVSVPSPGFYPNIFFEAETAGPVQALAGTLSVIAQPVVGWNSVTNVSDATEGKGLESDPALSARREVEVFRAGSASDLALASGVSSVAGVLSVLVLSNDTGVTNAEGVPPYSQEVIVYGPSANANDIAQAIWDNKTGGIPQSGSNTGVATDTLGLPHTMRYSVVTEEDVYVTLDLDVIASDYVGDVAAALSLVAWGVDNLTIGTDVKFSKVMGAASLIAGVQDVTSVKLGLAPAPALSANLVMSKRQIGKLDTGRIVINSTPVNVT